MLTIHYFFTQKPFNSWHSIQQMICKWNRDVSHKNTEAAQNKIIKTYCLERGQTWRRICGEAWDLGPDLASPAHSGIAHCMLLHPRTHTDNHIYTFTFTKTTTSYHYKTTQNQTTSNRYRHTDMHESIQLQQKKTITKFLGLARIQIHKTRKSPIAENIKNI